VDACVCVYDACVSDADCPGGGACACNPFEIGNTCVTGNCRVDQDCGVGGYCGPVISSACADEINEYRCYTAADQCLADSDCPAGEPCLAFSGGPWMCQPPQICR
jgi:Cys-rich repeat protein